MQLAVVSIEQEPVFFSNLSVEETLRFRAALCVEQQRWSLPRGRRERRHHHRWNDRRDGGRAHLIHEVVEESMRRFALYAARDVLVGGKSGAREIKGISGGEKKRLSIAIETMPILVENKIAARRAKDKNDDAQGATKTEKTAIREKLLLLLADEPTSGLDSFQAVAVMDALHAIANSHEQPAVVLASLHQPRGRILANLEDVLLIANANDGDGGSICYCGHMADAIAYFDRLGFARPRDGLFNIAEFLIDLVAVDESTPEAYARTCGQLAKIKGAWQATRENGDLDQNSSPTLDNMYSERNEIRTSNNDDADVNRRTHSGGGGGGGGGGDAQQRRRSTPLFQQLRLLIGRTARQARRDYWVNAVRAIATMTLAVTFGAMNRRLRNTTATVGRKAALIMQLCINSSFLAITKNLNAIPREKLIVMREMRGSLGGSLYGVAPYLLSKLCVEAPIDAMFPLLFGGIVLPMSGLYASTQPARAASMLASMVLTSTGASILGMTVGTLAPSYELAIAVGPVAMVLSILLADTTVLTGAASSDAQAEDEPAILMRLRGASLIKHGFEAMLYTEFHGNALGTRIGGEKDRQWPARVLGSSKNGSMCRGNVVLDQMGLSGSAAKSAKKVSAIALTLLATTFGALRMQRGGCDERFVPIVVVSAV